MSQRILYLQYTNPAAYPPLMHSSALLAEAGWEVLMLGIDVPSVAQLELPVNERVRYQQNGGPPGGALGPAKYAQFILRSMAAALRFKPDWCYASDYLSAPATNAVRAAMRTRVVYHEHDTPAVPASMFQQFALRARDALVRGAEVVIAPAQSRLAAIPAGNGQRFVVWNCPRRAEVASPKTTAENGKFRIVYHGSLSRDRLTPQFIDALALLPDYVELHIIGYETTGHQNYARELHERAERAGVSERVHYKGAIARRADLLELLRGFDLGISTVIDAADPNLATLAGASNKAFEYLASGIPLLMSRSLQWQEMFERPGYGLSCEPTDAASIAKAIQTFLAMPDRGRAMGEAGRRRILDEWNYETQFAPVMAALSA